jgi:hypothetical protein
VMELGIVNEPDRGHHSLGAYRARATGDRPGGRDGAATGLGAPSGQIVDSRRRWQAQWLAEEPHGCSAVEHDWGTAVESLLKNGDSRIRLEGSGREDTIVGLLG